MNIELIFLVTGAAIVYDTQIFSRKPRLLETNMIEMQASVIIQQVSSTCIQSRETIFLVFIHCHTKTVFAVTHEDSFLSHETQGRTVLLW